MKLDDVKARVVMIGETGKVDPEEAHAAEDALYLAFVRYCAQGHNQFHVAKLAKEILKTQDFQFARWFA